MEGRMDSVDKEQGPVAESPNLETSPLTDEASAQAFYHETQAKVKLDLGVYLMVLLRQYPIDELIKPGKLPGLRIREDELPPTVPLFAMEVEGRQSLVWNKDLTEDQRRQELLPYLQLHDLELARIADLVIMNVGHMLAQSASESPYYLTGYPGKYNRLPPLAERYSVEDLINPIDSPVLVEERFFVHLNIDQCAGIYLRFIDGPEVIVWHKDLPEDIRRRLLVECRV